MKLLPKAARDLRRAAALTKPFCDRCFGCDQVPIEVRRAAHEHVMSATKRCETVGVLVDTGGLVSRAVLGAMVREVFGR